MNNYEFHRLLHGRTDKKTGARMTTTLLAASAGVGRSHLCQVLNNVDGRGGHTRRKLFPLLTLKEIKSLGWEIMFEIWRKKTGGDCLPVEQSSTENNVPIESGVAA